MAYSSTISNGSSVSLADSLHSHSNSVEHLNTVYDVPSTNPYLYKPIRPTKSRLRPALPTVFLQLPGSDRSASPWKQQQPRRQGSVESTASTAASTAASSLPASNESIFTREVVDTVDFVRGPSPAGSNASGTNAVPPMTQAPSHAHRFSTCFNGGSASSLLDPGMMEVDPTAPKRPITRIKQNHYRTTTSNSESSDSDHYRLKEWSTPRVVKAPTLRISSKDLPSLPGYSKDPHHRFRSASSCSMYRDEVTTSSFTDDDSDILHIQLPEKKKKQSITPIAIARDAIQGTIRPPGPSPQSIKRKNQELKAEKEAIKTAKRIEENLRIRLEDPKAKDAGTTIDGLFGIGKEESKALRCGYAGLGIACDKRTWKATDDYQTLLRDTVRSSLYNLSPRSPRSSMKRKFSTPGITPGHSPHHSRSISSPSLLVSKGTETPRRRKEPPPPLDLSALSSFSTMNNSKTPQKKSTIKADKRKMDQNNRRRGDQVEELDDDDGALREMKTPRKISLKGILRSVRSITNLRSGR